MEVELCFTVQQTAPGTGKAVLVGCIPFGKLINNVRFHSRVKSESDDGYQREVAQNRITGIQRHIVSCFAQHRASKVAPLFPTSIILAFDYDAEPIGVGASLKISEIPEDILVVDGQHRLKAMLMLRDDKKNKEKLLAEKGLYAASRELDDYINSYFVNCSVLINYDLWEQAQVFASVNFNQKKVTKSLFYEIYGIDGPPGDDVAIPLQNEIYVAHKISEVLNTHDKSPLKGMIKMLGTGKGYFSQAVIVEALLKHLKRYEEWWEVVDALKNTKNNGPLNAIVREIMLYFKGVREVFADYWPKEGEKAQSIIVKSTGIPALIDFMVLLHQNMPEKLRKKLPKDKNYNDPEIIEEVAKYFKEAVSRLEPIGSVLFDPDSSAYKGAGGKALQKKLFERMKEYWTDSLSKS